MTLDRNKLLANIGSNLNDYPDVAERWRVGDPTVTALMTSIVETVVWLSRDNDVNIIEPFIKSKDRTIIADAISKGIMPVAAPCQHVLTIENVGAASLSLSQGRQIDDGTGRQWRLKAAVTIAGGETKDVLAEQVELREVTTTMPVSEPFYSLALSVTDEAFFCGIDVVNKTTNTPYFHTPKFMNAAAGDPAYSLHSDDLKSITLTFGDSDRAGKTVKAGESYTITIKQCYGEVEPDSLKQASLVNVYNNDETKLNMYFKQGGMIAKGANPLSVSQLRLLASYPSVYDRNAVFMGNFDYLIRWHFMNRFKFMSVWNETINEQHYGPSLDAINHLNLTVVPTFPGESAKLIEDIKQLVAKADSLLEGRVRVKAVQERPYHITVTGRLAAVHDVSAVRTQIKELLLESYGKGALATSYPNIDGFNLQEIATRIRNKIPAFQDRISDFTVSGESGSATAIKPHQWVFLNESSIEVNLTRTADTGNARWIM